MRLLLCVCLSFAQAAGRKGRTLVYCCTALTNLGCIVAYLNIMADVLSSVAGTIIPPGAEPSRNAYLASRCRSTHMCVCVMAHEYVCVCVRVCVCVHARCVIP